MGHLLHSDIVPGAATHVDGDDDGNIYITHMEDVGEVVEQNKAEQLARGKDITRNKDRWRKVATIPLTVWNELMKQKIVSDDGIHVINEKAFRKWLNDPDNRFFRSSEGKV